MTFSSSSASTSPVATTTSSDNRFSSLKVRNYQLYFFGQLLSQPGTYIQTVGQAWLVLELTHSGTDLGLVIAAQYLPVLLFGAWGGVIADRFNNRRIMCVTQSVAGMFAIGLAIVVFAHVVQLWMVMVLASGLGGILVADSPARQSFASEMVGPDQMKNAIALNLILNNVARVIGPSIGAALIAFVGIGYCFLLNGISYGAVVLALVFMDRSKLHPRPRSERTKGQLRLGFRHIASRRELRDTLAMLGITGLISSAMMVVLPLIASRTFHGNATTYADLTTAMGVGAVVGGLLCTKAKHPTLGRLTLFAIPWLICLIVSSAAPDMVFELASVTVMGMVTTMFTITANMTLQTYSDPQMRGRVMALWAVALLGTQPFGGPIFGFIADHSSPRWALGSSALGVISIMAIGLSSRPWLTGAIRKFRDGRTIPRILVWGGTASAGTIPADSALPALASVSSPQTESEE